MPRIRIDLPASFSFATDLPVRITDVNYGQHLGNDALLGLLHEARLQFLARHGYSEQNVEGCGLLMADAAMTYKREAFHGDLLRVEVAVGDIQRAGFDVYYRVTKIATAGTASAGDLVAEAKTGMVFFDYSKRKIQPTPAAFTARFEKAAPS